MLAGSSGTAVRRMTVNHEDVGSTPTPPAIFKMKALIFEFQDGAHEIKRIFFHLHEIKVLSINTFYRDEDIYHFETSRREKVRMYAKKHEDIFSEIMEFSSSDEYFKIYRLRAVDIDSAEPIKITGYLKDWVSNAMGN